MVFETKKSAMPTLALSMIVKNAEADLPDCLASAKSVVDEIVIADTGSTDATMQVARRAGARVFQIPWEDDFAKARNLALAEVTADWVLALDADERLDPGAAAVMPAHLSDADATGYQVTIRNYLPSMGCKIWDRRAIANQSNYAPAQKYPAYVDHENVRLFRRDREVYFTGRVHETVGNSVLELGRTLGTASFLIHHFGMVRGPEQAVAKTKFYRELGLRKIAETPGDAQAHFELGVVELEELGKAREALPYFERAIELKPEMGVARFFAGKCRFLLGDYSGSIVELGQSERCGHRTAIVAELMGDAHYNRGEYDMAREWYGTARNRAPDSVSAESKLGLAEVRSGRTAEGLRRVKSAIVKETANPDLHDRLISTQAWLGNTAEAAEAAENKLACVSARAEDFIRAASIRARLGEEERVAKVLEAGLRQFPESESLKALLSKSETVSADTAAISYKK